MTLRLSSVGFGRINGSIRTEAGDPPIVYPSDPGAGRGSTPPASTSTGTKPTRSTTPSDPAAAAAAKAAAAKAAADAAKAKALAARAAAAQSARNAEIASAVQQNITQLVKTPEGRQALRTGQAIVPTIQVPDSTTSMSEGPGYMTSGPQTVMPRSASSDTPGSGLGPNDLIPTGGTGAGGGSSSGSAASSGDSTTMKVVKYGGAAAALAAAFFLYRKFKKSKSF